jgi:hypothetical protein
MPLKRRAKPWNFINSLLVFALSFFVCSMIDLHYFFAMKKEDSLVTKASAHKASDGPDRGVCVVAQDVASMRSGRWVKPVDGEKIDTFSKRCPVRDSCHDQRGGKDLGE